jgi:hypothetical protein
MDERRVAVGATVVAAGATVVAAAGVAVRLMRHAGHGSDCSTALAAESLRGHCHSSVRVRVAAVRRPGGRAAGSRRLLPVPESCEP